MKSPTSAFDERILLVDRVSHAKRLTCAKRRVAETMTNPHEDVRFRQLYVEEYLGNEETSTGKRSGRSDLEQFVFYGGKYVGEGRFPLKKSHTIPLGKSPLKELE